MSEEKRVAAQAEQVGIERRSVAIDHKPRTCINPIIQDTGALI